MTDKTRCSEAAPGYEPSLSSRALQSVTNKLQCAMEHLRRSAPTGALWTSYGREV